MKKSEIRSALHRLNERLDNQWGYAQMCVKDDIVANLLKCVKR